MFLEDEGHLSRPLITDTPCVRTFNWGRLGFEGSPSSNAGGRLLQTGGATCFWSLRRVMLFDTLLIFHNQWPSECPVPTSVVLPWVQRGQGEPSPFRDTALECEELTCLLFRGLCSVASVSWPLFRSCYSHMPSSMTLTLFCFLNFSALSSG